MRLEGSVMNLHGSGLNELVGASWLMSVVYPELWARYVAACERERAESETKGAPALERAGIM